jgi:hypothetical protein
VDARVMCEVPLALCTCAWADGNGALAVARNPEIVTEG